MRRSLDVLQDYYVAELPVAGSLWLGSASCVPLHCLHCALPKLLALTSRDCPGNTTTLDFFQLLPICRSCGISTHGVRMVWHWDPGRSVCVGGWWEDREQPITHPQMSLWWDVIWENKILEEVTEYQNWTLEWKVVSHFSLVLCPPWDRNKWFRVSYEVVS